MWGTGPLHRRKRCFLAGCGFFCHILVAILSLDQEKAFHRVDWSFLRSTLQSMGFGPSFTRWFHLFYRDVRSAVKANGHLSQFLSLSRGVRQGCHRSPLLYVLYVEVLACTIRANPSVKEVTLSGAGEPLPVLSQFAEDTLLVVRGSVHPGDLHVVCSVWNWLRTEDEPGGIQKPLVGDLERPD